MCVCFGSLNSLYICWEMFWELNMLIGSMFEYLACCIHFYVLFPFLKNLVSSSSIASLQILNRFSLSSPSFFFSQQILTESRSIELSGFLLDRISIASSIHRAKFWALCPADRFLTDSRSIKVFSLSTNPQQHLDTFIFVKI